MSNKGIKQMSGINKVILIGNVGQEPESRYSPSGTQFCNVSLATSESWKDKQTGEKREQTEWHRVVFVAKLAEIAQQYLHKGSKVYIEGSIHTRKWQDQNGNDKYATEIKARNMQMLDSRQDQQQRPAQQPAAQPKQQAGGPPQDYDETIPF